MFNEIRVRQYDALERDITITCNGSPYTMKTGEKLWFMVKENIDDKDEDAVINLELTTPSVKIESVEVPVGTYYLEVGIIFNDDTTMTIIPYEDQPHPKFIVGTRERGNE